MNEKWIRCYNYVTIHIDNISYRVKAFLSSYDSGIIFNTDEKDYKKILAEFIYQKIVDSETVKPSVDQIYLQDDESFKPLIDSILRQSETLQQCFAQRSEIENLCERFIIAVRDEHAQLEKQCMIGIRAALNTFKMALSSYRVAEYNQNLRIAVDQWTRSLDRALKSIHIPAISSGQKQFIIESQEKWAKYGWTQPPSSPTGLFYSMPKNRKEADIIAQKYCKNSDMRDLFEELLKNKNVKKSDLIEAIHDFEDGRYKSCVLILFGLIDARLIRLQRDNDRDKRKRRAVGKTASRKLYNRITEENYVTQSVDVFFKCTNVFSCLNEVFEDANDFKQQPLIINRNFIDHGMLHRKVCKKDCIQIFLLYYNLLKLLEIISFKNAR